MGSLAAWQDFFPFICCSDLSGSQLLCAVHVQSLVQLSSFARRPKISLEQNTTCKKLERHLKEERAAECLDKTQIQLFFYTVYITMDLESPHLSRKKPTSRDFVLNTPSM